MVFKGSSNQNAVHGAVGQAKATPPAQRRCGASLRMSRHEFGGPASTRRPETGFLKKGDGSHTRHLVWQGASRQRFT